MFFLKLQKGVSLLIQKTDDIDYSSGSFIYIAADDKFKLKFQSLELISKFCWQDFKQKLYRLHVL